MAGLDDTFRPATTPDPGGGLCPGCRKAVTGEANFCPACGNDLRGNRSVTPAQSLPRDEIIDKRYRVLEKLGEGGMGSVYKVEHVRMGKIAALKVMRGDIALDRALKQRFLQEAQVVARLSHPNTVQVFDTGELDDGSLYITMEFVSGKDLAWHLKAHGPMSESRAIGIGLQLLASLQEAHEAGIVHRDIKPANVMLTRRRKGDEEQVKLLDFGIAKLQEAEARTTLDIVGTPAYMPPEQIRGEAVDGRADVYACGALLFELVSGRQLFVGQTPAEVITQHSSAPVPKIGDVLPTANISPRFEAVLEKALSKNAADRFQDAESMRAALGTLERQKAPTTADFTPVPVELAERMLSREDFDRFERTFRRKRALFPVAVLTVLAALGAIGYRAYELRAPPTHFGHEQEPNDRPDQATRIALGTPVTGTVGSAPAGERDRDLYRVDVPAGRLRVTLSAVDDLNLTVELSQLERSEGGEKLKRRVFLDDVGLGLPERLDGFAAQPGPLYVRVEERAFVSEPARPSRERALVPYTLTLDVLGSDAGAELEPNDMPTQAHALSFERATVATVGARVDDLERKAAARVDSPFSTIDWFQVDADEPCWVLVVPPVRGALLVHDGAWLELAAPTSPSARAPPVKGPLVVRGAPRLLKLESKRLRVVPADDAQASDEYLLAPAHPGPNGLLAVRALLDALRAQGRETQVPGAKELVRKELATAQDLARLAD